MSIPSALAAARIPPDPALPACQRDWHDRFPCRDYVELAADPAAVPAARLRLRADLGEWDLGIAADDAELVVTEIVANAVNATRAIHWPASRPPVRLWLRGNTGLLFILTWDGTPQDPQPACAGTWQEAGRGLMLVEAFSRWGYYHPPGDGAGKVIWAQVPKPAAR